MDTDETARSVLVAGETLVDVMADRRGPIDEATRFEPKFGGAPANVAFALAQIDEPPLFWTRIARDAFGDFLARRLAERGIPDAYVVRDDEAATTLAFVTHDADGDRAFRFYRDGAAETRMRPGTVPDDALDRLSWVHASGVALSAEPARSAVLDLVERAGRRDCTVSLDPNARPELWHSDREFAAVVRGALAHVDVVKATPGDLARAGFDADDQAGLARDVCALGPHTVLLTLGSDGAASYGTDESPIPGSARHSGYDVDVVDATGAGDCFLAAAIAALAAGVTDPERVLALANAVGAVATTEAGAVAALEDAASIRDLAGDVPWA